MNLTLPKTFDAMELDLNGNRYVEPIANDFDKHEIINPLIESAQDRVITGNVGNSQMRWDAIVEVGSWMGANAIMMADWRGERDMWRVVYCVDTWKGGRDIIGTVAKVIGPKSLFQQFCKNIGSRLHRSITPCVGRSTTWAEIWPYQVAAVFIDADHTYEACKEDIEAWWPHVAPGGVLIGHDYHSFPGVKKAADEFGIDGTEGDLFWKWKDK